MIEVKINGLDNLREALLSIVPKLRVRALRNALAEGARLVRDTARSRTPILKLSTFAGSSAFRRGIRRPGTVRKAISVRTSKSARRAGDVGVFVNVRPAKGADRGAKNPNDPFYGRFVQWGTKFKPGANFLQAGAQRLPQALQVFIQRIGPAIEKLNKPKAPAP